MYVYVYVFICMYISSVCMVVQLFLITLRLHRRPRVICKSLFVTWTASKVFRIHPSTLSVLGEKFPIVALNWLYIDGTSCLHIPTPLPPAHTHFSPTHGIVCLPCLSPADACLNFQLISFHFIFAVKKLQAALAQAVSDRCVLTLHIVQIWVYVARPLREGRGRCCLVRYKLEDRLRDSRKVKVNLYNTKV